MMWYVYFVVGYQQASGQWFEISGDWSMVENQLKYWSKPLHKKVVHEPSVLAVVQFCGGKKHSFEATDEVMAVRELAGDHSLAEQVFKYLRIG